LSDENWALNIEICDLINEQDDGPRDAVRAIKKRLQLNAGKNHTVVMHTLIVIYSALIISLWQFSNWQYILILGS
jgi:hypothetical protein